MGIPPELRVSIYRELLVDGTYTPVTAQSFHEPSILLASKQIRSEAAIIYYSEANFEVDTQDYDPTAAARFALTVSPYVSSRGEPRMSGTVSLTGARSSNWGNVMRWLKYIHEDKLPWGFVVNPDTAEEWVLDACEAVVWPGKAITWENVEKILESLHMALIEIDDRWA